VQWLTLLDVEHRQSVLNVFLSIHFATDLTVIAFIGQPPQLVPPPRCRGCRDWEAFSSVVRRFREVDRRSSVAVALVQAFSMPASSRT